MANDSFKYRSKGDLLSSGTRSAAVTPHDTNEIEVTRQIYIAADGVLYIALQDDAAAKSFGTVTAGATYDWRVRLVHTSTTATVIAIY
jgi:hypothetical protein